MTMTDEKMLEMNTTLEKASALKTELSKLQHIKDDLLANHSSDDAQFTDNRSRIIGLAILKWTKESEDDYNAIVDIIEKRITAVNSEYEAL